MVGMKHTTDTYAPSDWFVQRADDGASSPVVSLSLSTSELRAAHLNISEWLRQIEERMVDLGIEVPTYDA